MLHAAKQHFPVWFYHFGYKGKYSYGDWFASTNETIDFNWGKFWNWGKFTIRENTLSHNFHNAFQEQYSTLAEKFVGYNIGGATNDATFVILKILDSQQLRVLFGGKKPRSN